MPTVSTPGARIEYWKAGRGPAVLMIQGAGIIGAGWRPQIDDLARDYTVLWFDNRGIGQSASDRGRLSIEVMAADATAVLDAADVERCHVIGHSMGGLIAQELALTQRPRVASLALLCTFATGRDASALSWEMVLLALRTRIGTASMRRRAFLEMIVPDHVLHSVDAERMAAELAPLIGHDLARQPSIAMKQVGAMSRYDARARLGGLAGIPTLVASAELDRIARPRSGRALAEAIPGARYVEWPGAAHAAPIHDAAMVNVLLRAHLSSAQLQ
jgi:pimeloyl-ACP methyl ester carboxylesterase